MAVKTKRGAPAGRQVDDLTQLLAPRDADGGVLTRDTTALLYIDELGVSIEPLVSGPGFAVRSTDASHLIGIIRRQETGSSQLGEGRGEWILAWLSETPRKDAASFWVTPAADCVSLLNALAELQRWHHAYPMTSMTDDPRTATLGHISGYRSPSWSSVAGPGVPAVLLSVVRVPGSSDDSPLFSPLVDLGSPTSAKYPSVVEARNAALFRAFRLSNAVMPLPLQNARRAA